VPAREPLTAARILWGVTVQTKVVSAFAAGRGGDAIVLVFEYMAATQAETRQAETGQAETGQPVPAEIGGLPAVLQRECRDLPAAYRPPGTFLIADHRGQPVGCVGLAVCSDEITAQVKRLYVRPAMRGNGIARTLMNHAHDHAARHGINRLVLDVLPARAAVIAFYRRLGYTETEPFAAQSPIPLVCMQRPVTSDDMLMPAAMRRGGSGGPAAPAPVPWLDCR
jgi:GNAT superfamily N-acetyltransferase